MSRSRPKGVSRSVKTSVGYGALARNTITPYSRILGPEGLRKEQQRVQERLQEGLRGKLKDLKAK